MRRMLFITALALFLAEPLWAQRGGGGHGGGHASFGGGHASFSGSHAGGFSGGHVSSGMRSGFSRGPARAYNRGFSRGFDHRNGFHNNFHGHFRDRDRFRSNCFGYGCVGYGYPWWGGYYDPWLWDWSSDDARFDADYNNNLADANEMNEQSLEQQRMMRQEEADGDQDIYARPNRSNDPAPAQTTGTPIMPPTVLVFRDRHQQEIQNYAIVGQMLWIFASPHTQKVPLSDLDLAATEKANDDRGITFQVPNLNQGQ